MGPPAGELPERIMMPDEQPENLVKPLPEAEQVKKILLLDSDPTSCDHRAKAIRDRGAHVDCAGDGPQARALWHPGSHELVLIDFRSAGVQADDFYQYARGANRKQKFGFYLDKPPYLTLSYQQYESARAAESSTPTAASAARAENDKANYETGLPEAAKRIATVRRLTRPATSAGGTRLRGTPVSAAMRIASRILGGAE
jgi:CheY-like chemotaxis protein